METNKKQVAFKGLYIYLTVYVISEGMFILDRRR